MKYLKLTPLLLCVFILSSCIRDGEDLENCFRNIRIELRWIDTRPLSDNEQVNIAITSSSGETTAITSDIYGTDVDLLADTYTLVGWEAAENVILNRENATVSVATRADGVLLNPSPFSAGMTRAEVVFQYDSLIIPLPMYQQTRPLIVEVEFIDTDSPIINEFPPLENLSATLSGITLERDINDAFIESATRQSTGAIRNGKVAYDLIEDPEPREGGIWYIGANNLLGFDPGAVHTFDLTVKFQGQEPMDISFDVSDQLSEFETRNIHEPWYIIIRLSLDSSLDVSIQDWIAGPESWLIAQ